MFIYGIGILLMTKNLKAEFPDVTHPWYSDNAGALGTFTNVELYFNLLKQFRPGHGYYPEPSKIVLIMHPDNPKYGKKVWLVSRV